MKQTLPQHVAIVMDGNGRWAKQRGMPRAEGHRAGVEAVKAVVRACVEKKIKVLSLFAFSCENWSRPEQEVDFLMQMFIHALGHEIQSLHEHGVNLRFIGDRAQLSTALCTEMDLAQTLTQHNQQLTLNVLINYSGQWDILQAAKAVATQVVNGAITVDAINDEVFAAQLSTAQLPDPDLFIRTSGEQRISNFFLWQLAFTELYFSTVHWPDFNASEFDRALACFSSRERRYGQLTP